MLHLLKGSAIRNESGKRMDVGGSQGNLVSRPLRKGAQRDAIEAPIDGASVSRRRSMWRMRQFCGSEPQGNLDGIRKFIDAGFDHVCASGGADQEGFVRSY